MSSLLVIARLRTGATSAKPQRLAAIALLTFTTWACTFPEFAVDTDPARPGTSGGASAGRESGGVAGAAAGSNAGMPSGGAGSGGAAGGGQANAGAGSHDSGGRAGAENGGTASSAGKGGSDAVAGNGPDGGAGGGPSAPKTCADYLELPKDCVCRDGSGHAYLFCSTMRPWSQGVSRCGYYDMSLVAIDSPSEDAWILKQARAITDPRPLTFYWIGASSSGSPGIWHWADGSVFWRGNASGSAEGHAYVNWRITSPQNTKSAACVFADENGWEEGDCTINRGYVCEAGM